MNADRLRTSSLIAAAIVVVAAVAALAAWRSSDGDDVARLGETTTGGIEIDAATVDADDVMNRPYERFDGTEAALADELGRPIVVNFFASTCAPCIKEMPAFESVHRELGDRVAFVGLAVQDRRSDAERLVERTGVTYPIGDDPDALFADAFGSLALPTTAIIGADGAILDVHVGELTADELRERLEPALR